MTDDPSTWPMEKAKTPQQIYDSANREGLERVTEWGQRPYVPDGVKANWEYVGFVEREIQGRIMAIAKWRRWDRSS